MHSFRYLLCFLVVGVLAGAFLVRIFKMEDSGRRSAFFCFILQIFTIVGPLAFVVQGCDEVNLAGWRVPYGARFVGKQVLNCLYLGIRTVVFRCSNFNYKDVVAS